ncbi:MFS transporter [Archangium gephyra]|nr:MFS transporter [Archangium gephyra]
MADRTTRLLRFAVFAAAFDTFLLAPMLVSIATDTGTTLTAAAGMASAYLLAYGVMQPVWSVVSDRIGRGAVVRWGLLGAAVTGVLCAAASSLGPLVLGRLLAGGAVAAVMPTSITYVGDTFPVERRQGAIADLNASYAAGSALGTLAGGAAAAYASWRVGFLGSAVLAGVLAVVLARLTHCPGAGRGGLRHRIRAVLGTPWALAVIGLALVEGAALLGFLGFLAPALVTAGHRPGIAGLVVAAYGGAVLLWTRVVKQWAVRLPPAALIAIGATMLVAGYGSAALSPGVAGVLAASILVGGAMAFMHSMLQVWATEVVPAARALVVALFVGALFLGSATAMRVFSPLAGHGAFRQLFAVPALLAVPMGLAAVVGRHRTYRR